MKLPNRHKFATLTALAVLLAGMSTGFITICDALLYGEPDEGDTIFVTVHAGDVAEDITGSWGLLYRFSLCSPPPEGVYPRIHTDTRLLENNVTVDLVTSTATPPGHYFIDYAEADLGFLFEPGYFVAGTLDVTVQENQNPVTACMAVFGEGEVIFVNQTVTYYACCSTGPEGDPVVQYKWWFDYNGNPSSPPSVTVTSCETTHTYSTPGPRTVRLVVRTQNGLEASDTQDIVVNGL